jgi:hypothetical protein
LAALIIHRTANEKLKWKIEEEVKRQREKERERKRAKASEIYHFPFQPRRRPLKSLEQQKANSGGVGGVSFGIREDNYSSGLPRDNVHRDTDLLPYISLSFTNFALTTRHSKIKSGNPLLLLCETTPLHRHYHRHDAAAAAVPSFFDFGAYSQADILDGGVAGVGPRQAEHNRRRSRHATTA